MTDLTIIPANVVADPKASMISGSCGESITAGQAVYKSAATKKWLRADSNSPEAEVRKAIGIALNGGSLNQPLRILRRGKITIGATLVPGLAYYLSDIPGGICQAADVVVGDYICFIGLASSSSVLDVSIQFPNVAAVSGTASRSAQAAQALGELGQSATATHASSWVGPTWSLTNHDPNISISGTNNQTATRTGVSGSVFNAFSNTGATTGSRYVEFNIVTCDTPTGGASTIWLGAANNAMGISEFPFPITNAVALGNDGGGLRHNSSVDDPTSFAVIPFGAGDVLGMLLDLDANTVRYRKNGGSYCNAVDISYMRPIGTEPIFLFMDITSTSTANQSVSFGNV